MTQTPLLEIKDLVVQYAVEDGTVRAVDHLNMELGFGETLGFVGETGAGKTTTALAVMRLIESPGRIIQGQILFEGQDLLLTSVEEIRAIRGKKIAMIFQDPMTSLNPNMTVGEQIAEMIMIHEKISKAQAMAKAEKMLEMVDIQAERAKDYPHQFSGGMKRRVNIGVALLHKPKVLYLDEPTVGIDPQSRRSILDGVIALKNQGMTVLYTTHYMEEAQELSDRIAIMDHGKIIANDTHDNLIRLVGQKTRISLSINSEPESMIESWKACNGVSTIVVEDAKINLLVDDSNKVLPRLFETAAAKNVRITSVEIQEPNLETVFLHLTGRALRDA